MSYVDIVIYVRSLPILETWPPIYRGQERTVRDRLKASQVYTHIYFRYTPCLTDFTFEFIQRPISPILSPSSRIFVELTPRQLAPTVGTQGVGIMNLTAFLLLANSNPEVDENQEMELTIRSLSFYVGPSGSTRLSDPTKSGPSASKAERIIISGSSVGSSSEVNSLVSLTTTEDMPKGLEEFDETRGKLDMEATVIKPHDSPRDFATGSSGVSRSVHQLCVIITEVAEENNHEGNKEVNIQVDKPRSNSKKEKEKIHVSIGEWRIIMSAINHGTEIPTDSRREVLMGYQYTLHQRRKKLREERDVFMRSRDDNSTSSGGIGMSTAMHQSPALKGTETRSTIGGQQHRQEKKAMQKI
jgi:hypothetical protein